MTSYHASPPSPSPSPSSVAQMVSSLRIWQAVHLCAWEPFPVRGVIPRPLSAGVDLTPTVFPARTLYWIVPQDGETWDTVMERNRIWHDLAVAHLRRCYAAWYTGVVPFDYAIVQARNPEVHQWRARFLTTAQIGWTCWFCGASCAKGVPAIWPRRRRQCETCLAPRRPPWLSPWRAWRWERQGQRPLLRPDEWPPPKPWRRRPVTPRDERARMGGWS